MSDLTDRSKKRELLQILDERQQVAPGRGKPENDASARILATLFYWYNLFIQMPGSHKGRSGHLLRIESKSDTSWVILTLGNSACMGPTD